MPGVNSFSNSQSRDVMPTSESSDTMREPSPCRKSLPESCYQVTIYWSEHKLTIHQEEDNEEAVLFRIKYSILT
jgi:hypothetical protein